jgi:hypothetical protein
VWIGVTYVLSFLQEFEEDDAKLQRKAKLVARALQQSRHAVVYTGAGVSTSAKIPGTPHFHPSTSLHVITPY